MVGRGITNGSVIKSCLSEFVIETFPETPPLLSNTRYYPNLDTIRSKVARTIRKINLTRVDQVALENYCLHIQKEDQQCNVHFRRKSDPGNFALLDLIVIKYLNIQVIEY